MSTKQRSHLCDTPREELASTLTHGMGALLGAAALVWMLRLADGDLFRTVSAGVFGGSLVLLYTSSTLYHACSRPRLKAFFQWLDHACIYLLSHEASYVNAHALVVDGGLGAGVARSAA